MQNTQKKYPPYPTDNHDIMVQALGILEEHKILDIGAGHRPFTKANVIVDIDLQSGHHRDGAQIFLDKEKHIYVQADIMDLPFADKSFDFVFCIHVLEHVKDPAKACSELIRVAKRGFIETPRKWTEFYAGYPTHRWLVDDTDSILRFEPIEFNSSPFMNFALPPLWTSEKLLDRLNNDFHNIPCVQMVWNDSFQYSVKPHSPDYDLLDSKLNLAKRHYSFAKNILYWAAGYEHGIYHSGRALELCPDNKDYLKLYAFYLALAGRWKESLNHGLTLKTAIYALSCKILLKSLHWAQKKIRYILKFCEQ